MSRSRFDIAGLGALQGPSGWAPRTGAQIPDTRSEVTSSSTSLRHQLLTLSRCSLGLEKRIEAVTSGRRGSFGPTLVFNLPSTFLQDFFFFSLNSATLGKSLQFWKLSISD